jgi:choline-sulfatase
MAEACAEFIRQSHDRPFLLVASFINPHDICYMAINDHDRRRGSPLRKNEAQQVLAEVLSHRNDIPNEEEFFATRCPPLPENHQVPNGVPDAIKPPYGGFRGHAFDNWGERQWRLHRWAYAQLTNRVDAQIGVVLDALRETGKQEKTLVVFTSDHGDLDGAHRLEHKSFFYEESARVPFIVSWEGVTAAGKVDRRHLVSTGLDLIPTLCDFAAVEVPERLRGLSVRALAEGRDPERWRKCVVTENRIGRMVCTGQFKYSVYPAGQQREFLVDLVKDPGEMTNLADDPTYGQQLARHRALMQQWVQQTKDRLARPYIIAANMSPSQ